MIRTFLAATALAVFAVAPAALAAQAAPAAAGLPTWSIDVAHSEVNFRIRHFMSRVSGTFTDWSGTIQGDPANWSGGSVTASLMRPPCIPIICSRRALGCTWTRITTPSAVCTTALLRSDVDA